MKNYMIVVVAVFYFVAQTLPVFSQPASANAKVVAKSEVKDNSSLDYGYGVNDASFLTFGTQYWMAKNLAVVTFSNGDKIDEVKSNEEWVKAGAEKRPAWCYYNNDPANAATYGVLYNWYAVSDPRGLAPRGWHVASKYEWITLIAFLGNGNVAGKKLKSTSDWNAVSGIDRNGTNESGFAALPAGLRFASDGNFSGIGERAQFWTSTQNDSDRGAIVLIGILNAIDINRAFKSFGYAVRCVKN